MKKSTLPNKTTRTLGIFKSTKATGAPTVVTTDPTSLLSLSTTHVFNR